MAVPGVSDEPVGFDLVAAFFGALGIGSPLHRLPESETGHGRDVRGGSGGHAAVRGESGHVTWLLPDRRPEVHLLA